MRADCLGGTGEEEMKAYPNHVKTLHLMTPDENMELHLHSIGGKELDIQAKGVGEDGELSRVDLGRIPRKGAIILRDFLNYAYPAGDSNG